MSILLAVATESYAALCTDCQHTNMRTKERADINKPKIDTFLGQFGIAHCGSMYTAAICMGTMSNIASKPSVRLDSVEDVAELMKEVYASFIEKEVEIEAQCTSVFVIAGLFKNGHPGLALISNDGIVGYTIIDGTINSHIQVYPPHDMPRPQQIC